MIKALVHFVIKNKNKNGTQYNNVWIKRNLLLKSALVLQLLQPLQFSPILAFLHLAILDVWK